jgi:hypothetical protein
MLQYRAARQESKQVCETTRRSPAGRSTTAGCPILRVLASNEDDIASCSPEEGDFVQIIQYGDYYQLLYVPSTSYE